MGKDKSYGKKPKLLFQEETNYYQKEAKDFYLVYDLRIIQKLKVVKFGIWKGIIFMILPVWVSGLVRLAMQMKI